MKATPYILAALLLLLAWLLPIHKMPWTTFGSEVLTFLSALVLLSVFINKDIKIPKPQLFVLPVLAIPLINGDLAKFFILVMRCCALLILPCFG